MADSEEQQDLSRTIRLDNDNVEQTTVTSGTAADLGKTQALPTARTRIFALKRHRDVGEVMAELRDAPPRRDVVFSAAEDNLEPLTGAYERGDEFAEGGQGVLYRGFDRRLQRLVAIKSLREEFNGCAEQRGRFLTEARITAQLDHPAVVPIYTLNSDDRSGLHLAMKLINGETFKAYLEQTATHYRLDGIAGYDEAKALRDRLDIFLKVCDALEYAHSRNVMHCDLKPSNIMIGEYRETYIMDWGIARRIDDQDQVTDAAPQTQVCGTPQYLAPEVIRGERGDLRADIFAMGVILFETVTLKNAFSGNDVPELLNNIRSGCMESVEHRFKAPLDADLRAIIRKAAANCPQERYQHICDLSSDLRRYLSGFEVAARPDCAVMKIVRWFYLHRRLTLIVMLCGLLLGTGALSFAFYREYRVSEQQRQRDYAHGLAFTLCSQVGNQLDKQLGKLENMAYILASDIQFMLQYDLHPDDRVKEKNDAFLPVTELKKQETPTMVHSQFHHGKIDLENIVYNTVQPTSRRQLAQRLTTVARFIPRLLQTILESSLDAHISEANFKDAKNKALRDGTPVVRVMFGFSDGLFIAYPASPGFPAVYDPRKRPWYQAIIRNPNAPAVWLAPYIDSIPDFGLVLSCSVPLNLLGTSGRGVCSMDVSLAELVEELHSAGSHGSFLLAKDIVDADGRIIISTTRNFAETRMLNVKNAAGEVEFAQFGDSSLFAEMKARRSGVITRNVAGREIIYAFCHIRSVDWFYVEKLDMQLLLQQRPGVSQVEKRKMK